MMIRVIAAVGCALVICGLVVVVAGGASGGQSPVERLPGSTNNFGIGMGMASDGHGELAVAYVSERGVYVTATRRGRFGSARLLPHSKGVEFAADVARNRRGDLAAAWVVNDGSVPPVGEADDGCCDRIWTAVVRRNGTTTPAREISPPGVNAGINAVAITQRGRVAVAYTADEARREFNIALGSITRGVRPRGSFSLDPLAFVGGIVARGDGWVVGYTSGGYRQTHIALRERTVTAGGRVSAARRVGRVAAPSPGFEQVARARYGAIVLIPSRENTWLVDWHFGSRARVLNTHFDPKQKLFMATDANGAAAVLGDISDTSAVIRSRAPGSGLGTPRKLRFPRIRYLADSVQPGVTSGGAPFALAASGAPGRVRILLAQPGHRARRIATFDRNARVVGQLPARGRQVLSVGGGQHAALYVVGPQLAH